MDGSDDSLGLGLNDFLLSKGLEENILHAIESAVQVLYLPAGATLFFQVDQGDCLYGFASGQLEISGCYPDGSQLSVDILEPGAILGEIAILTGRVRTATARMLVDCKLYRLSREGSIGTRASRAGSLTPDPTGLEWEQQGFSPSV